MRLYDFSIYARIRAERKAAQAVAETVANIDKPGSVVELKQKMGEWLNLHRQVLRRSA